MRHYTSRRYGTDMRLEFRSEDGKHARRYVQDMTPVMERARHMAHRRDHGMRRGGKLFEAYLGQVPASVLIDYLGKRKIPLDVYARNEGGVRDKFKHWLMTNPDLKKLQPDYYGAKIGSNSIVVPRAPNNTRFKESECQTPSKTTAT